MGDHATGGARASAPAPSRAAARFAEAWGEPDLVARAPGRVNLIGEHTDYNEGFTLPMALPFDTAVALGSTGDPTRGSVVVDSTGFGSFELAPDARPEDTPAWARHVVGVVQLLRESGIPAAGWRATVDTDIPTGASLSSSAALEVALITALLARAGIAWESIDIARLGQRVENEIVGIPSGIMDQFISAAAVVGHASLMDCRALTLSPVRVPGEAAIVILDTGTRRVLVDAEYGDRRAACERAAAAIGVPSLRDASLADLDAVRDPVDRRRARHVVTENARTLAAAESLHAREITELGDLMSASHRSLRDDFEVSGPGLDAIVEVAHGSPGCLGARMTGGGFAGCAVALVRRGVAGAFVDAVVRGYSWSGHRARAWVCAPSAGASCL